MRIGPDLNSRQAQFSVQPVSTLREGSVLAFDYGEKRIGVAIGELSLGIAHPLQTLTAHSDRARLGLIEPLVAEWAPVLLVVGLPMHMDDREHAMSTRCRAFAAKLQTRFRLPTVLVDERLTSAAAESTLHEAGVHGAKRALLVDRVAAQHILETYFSSRPT